MYAGPKQPEMIAPFGYGSETPEELEHVAQISIKHARSLDLWALVECVLFRGTHRVQWIHGKDGSWKSLTIKPESIIIYQLLININPSYHVIIKTAMMKAMRLFTSSGNSFVVITADQAIYKLIVDNLWMGSEKQFQKAHAWLGKNICWWTL